MSLLPKEKTKPKVDLSAFNFLLHSAPKTGKTTFASGYPDALFLATEQGHNALSCFKVDIVNWDTLLDVGAELAAGGHDFKTAIIDTVDNALAMCRLYVCKKYGVEHEADLSYGKGYALILAEFGRVITKLSQLGLGLVMISHSEILEITTRTGTTHKIVPSIKDKARKLILGMSDFIFYGDIQVVKEPDGSETLRRVWRTKPHPNYDAGDRTGRLPDPLPMDFQIFKTEFEKAVAGLAAEQAAPKAAAKPAAVKPNPGK
jgi:hypothetical protein